MSGTDDPAEDVGSVSEEAAKLFGALSDWARDQAPAGSDAGPTGFAGLAGQAAEHAARAVRDVDEHLATGSPECTWCPVCRAVHVVRQTSPEVRAHLAQAASSLLQAAAGVMATAVPSEDTPGRGHGVERIDLDPADPDAEGVDDADHQEDDE